MLPGLGTKSIWRVFLINSIQTKFTNAIIYSLPMRIVQGGGIISGEVKLAVTLQFLGESLYMDLVLLFESSFNHTHKIAKYVVQNWLIHESFYLINSVAYCQDDEKMLDAAVQFARALKGVINGCIGALDGWVVRIKKPSHLDGVEKPNFFCQFFFLQSKGYFAIDVKVIVNKN